MPKRLDDKQLGQLAADVRRLAEQAASTETLLTKVRNDLKVKKDQLTVQYGGADITK